MKAIIILMAIQFVVVFVIVFAALLIFYPEGPK